MSLNATNAFLLNDNQLLGMACQLVIDDESIFNVQKISAEAMTKPLTYGLLLTFFPFKQNPFHKFQREITTQSSKLLLLLTLISSSVLKILRGHTKLLLIYVKIY